MVAIDLRGGNAGRQIAANLGVYDEEWASKLEGRDAVIHLAADADPHMTAETANMNHLIFENVLRASLEKGVSRFVFASSMWVVAGHRFSRRLLAADIPAKPINPYGESKLRSELAGLRACRGRPMDFIALRVGAYDPSIVAPDKKLDQGSWGQAMWISTRDLCNGFEAAVTAPGPQNVVLNLTSENRPARFDIVRTIQAIGYRPRDGGKLQMSKKVWVADLKARYTLATGRVKAGWF